MKFSMEKAWDMALTLIKGNRDLLLAIGGLFFVLPNLLSLMLADQPQPPENPTPEQAIEFMQQSLTGGSPFVLVAAVLTLIGTLAIIALLGDDDRPTVGEALKRGGKGLLAYLMAGLILALGLGLLGGALIGIPMAVGVAPISVLGALVLVVVLIYVMVKTSLVPAIIITEHQQNPIAAIKRSWLLTKGNSPRLLMFYVLLAIPYAILMLLVGGVFGALGGLIGGADVARFIGAVPESLVAGAWGVLSATITIAIYRQLSAAPGAAQAEVFD